MCAHCCHSAGRRPPCASVDTRQTSTFRAAASPPGRIGARMRGLRAAALLLLAASCVAQNIYDACNWNNAHGTVEKANGGVPIGLAFWINGELADWDPVVITTSNTTVTSDGAYENVTTSRSLHPCNDAAELAAIATPTGVISTTPTGSTEPAPSIWKSVYRPVTDTMSVLHTDVTQLYQLLDYYTAYHVNDTLNVSFVNATASPPPPPGSSSGGLLGLAPPPPPPNGTFDKVTSLYCRPPWEAPITSVNVTTYVTTNFTNSTTNITTYITNSTTNVTNFTDWRQVCPPANNTARFMSMVAYYGHGANAVRSEPRYLFSEDDTITGGVGVATQLILVARFNSGVLKYLQWAELGCSGCGGPKDPQCMQVGTSGSKLACATLPTNPDTGLAITSCRDYYNKTVTDTDNTTNVTTTTSSLYSLCGTGLYVGFSGTDRYGKPLKTGGQIDMLRKYSVSKLSSRALSYAKLAKAYVKEQVPTVAVSSGSVNS